MSINNFFKIDEKLLEFDKKALDACKEQFARIEEITEYNQLKVLSAFINNGVSEAAMSGSTGYGYDDRGRETLDKCLSPLLRNRTWLIKYYFFYL